MLPMVAVTTTTPGALYVANFNPPEEEMLESTVRIRSHVAAAAMSVSESTVGIRSHVVAGATLVTPSKTFDKDHEASLDKKPAARVTAASTSSEEDIANGVMINKNKHVRCDDTSMFMDDHIAIAVPVTGMMTHNVPSLPDRQDWMGGGGDYCYALLSLPKKTMSERILVM